MINSSNDGSVCILELARPEKKNAFTAAMYEQLRDLLIAADANEAVTAILITGAGSAFSAGNDLEDFLKFPPVDEDAPPFSFLKALAQVRKPVIAAVNGLAVGIGATMLFHCDLVYAQSTARFSFPFVSLGLVPEGGSSLLLPRLVGHRRASEILLLGAPLSAEEAKAIGLVNAVVEQPVLEVALENARRISQLPRGAVAATKALLTQPSDVVAQINREAIAFVRRTTSASAKEAFSAFLEKRKPDFTGLD